MDKGRRLAFDYGDVRIGVAVSDPEGIIASPRDFIENVVSKDDVAFIRSLRELMEEVQPIYVVIGLPLHLHGGTSAKSESVRAFAGLVAQITAAKIFFVDERLSTVNAAASLRAAGKSAKTSKGLIDSASAATILEAALMAEKSQGQPSPLHFGDTS